MAVPTITSVTPSSGSYKGATTVALVGTGFTGTTGVTVGGVAAASFAVVDDTHLTLVTPAVATSAVGVKDIIVTNATGPSVAGAGDHFTYTLAYVQAEGSVDGTDYFMDVAITPANLASGQLVERFDPVKYPSRNLSGVAKVGSGGALEPGPGGAVLSEKDSSYN